MKSAQHNDRYGDESGVIVSLCRSCLLAVPRVTHGTHDDNVFQAFGDQLQNGNEAIYRFAGLLQPAAPAIRLCYLRSVLRRGQEQETSPGQRAGGSNQTAMRANRRLVYETLSTPCSPVSSSAPLAIAASLLGSGKRSRSAAGGALLLRAPAPSAKPRFSRRLGSAGAHSALLVELFSVSPTCAHIDYCRRLLLVGDELAHHVARSSSVAARCSRGGPACASPPDTSSSNRASMPCVNARRAVLLRLLLACSLLQPLALRLVPRAPRLP